MWNTCTIFHQKKKYVYNYCFVKSIQTRKVKAVSWAWGFNFLAMTFVRSIYTWKDTESSTHCGKEGLMWTMGSQQRKTKKRRLIKSQRREYQIAIKTEGVACVCMITHDHVYRHIYNQYTMQTNLTNRTRWYKVGAFLFYIWIMNSSNNFLMNELLQ